LEQDALDKLWNNRSDRDLHVPFLAINPGMNRHVLHRELNFDRQPPQLHHLGQAEPDGDRPDVLRRRSPVREDVTRVAEAPTLAKEDRGDGLKVHWVGIGPAVHAADGPPLLWEHADEVSLGEVAYHHGRAELPFSLAGEG